MNTSVAKITKIETFCDENVKNEDLMKFNENIKAHG